MNNLTKKQCQEEILRLEKLITRSLDEPWVSIAYIEQRIWWMDRLGELVAQEEGFPGRKFHK